MMKYFFTLLCVAMCHLTVMAQEESQAAGGFECSSHEFVLG